MATIQHTVEQIKDFKDDCHVITWTPMTQTGLDVGTPLKMPGSADRSVQLLGTLGTGGVVTMEGSNVPEPSVNADYATLTDPQGNALTLDTLKIEQISEATLWIRPRVTAGNGSTSLTVRMLVRRLA